MRSFIKELVNTASTKEIGEAEKRELLRVAVSFAGTYDDMGGSRAFASRIIKRAKKLEESLEWGTSGSGATRENYEAMVEAERAGIAVLSMVKKFVMDFVHTAIRVEEDAVWKARLLNAATGFANSYSDVKNDPAFFNKISRIVETLPTKPLTTDLEFIGAFRKAVKEDNTVAKEYILRRLGENIEPFTMDIIDWAEEEGVDPLRKEELLKLAMEFARSYGKMTGDHSLHRRIHKAAFTARLAAPLVLQSTSALVTIDMPKASEVEDNIFYPDNIVINAGESVRWVNHDEISHVIGTLDFISSGHFYAPYIGPISSFEASFPRPGEYYYICYIHESMIGKITVK